VALNCVANGRMLREGPFSELWIQPAAGDAGGALGAALSVWHEHLDQPRQAGSADSMHGAYLGPAFSNDQIEAFLRTSGAPYRRLDDDALMAQLAALLEQDKVIGWFHGRMEFGPRALGGRSIIGDPRSPRMQSVMNLKIKYRESFRPFAPAVLAERVSDWFEHRGSSPYMLLVAPVAEARRVEMSDDQQRLFGIDKLKVVRSEVPAITHVDYSARLQTVHRETNPRFHRLIEVFAERTGCPLLVNTSFNVRGEPIVGSPEDAYRCFMRTEMDYLVLENCLLAKSDQPAPPRDDSWQQQFELD
jgi:carbamoyltransferase